MRIVVAYKWTSDPEEATVRPDGTVDRPGLARLQSTVPSGRTVASSGSLVHL